ncbi:MAG: cation:proton antiporter subunit C [Parvibaculaceae bacterium]|jgi:multicomponent Na+:H+ antiporter subunit C|nr:cation:proton antiporter subunit C [Parvibaculaceae bacterium]HBM87046.1 Na+/H+ antiporter subunit C [Rhodobiaceae bacterium]|tara:strand:- start:494 stop:913 length:420 start_codon:yes stop_codon:yes gene_type:complete
MWDEMTVEFFVNHYNYWMTVILMMIGLYVVVSRGNLVKKIVGLNLFQTSVFMLYISMAKILGGTAPILTDNPNEVYSNPLPHVLILTAIVVGVATTALGLALIIRIRESFDTIEEDEIFDIEQQMAKTSHPHAETPNKC